MRIFPRIRRASASPARAAAFHWFSITALALAAAAPAARAQSFASQQIPLASPTSFLVAGDIDRDGAIDLVAPDSVGSALTWLRGDGVGGFAAPASFPASFAIQRVVLGDLDMNGILDAFASDGTGKIVGMLGSAAGGFGAPFAIQLPATCDVRAIGDFTSDGIPDVLATIANPASNTRILVGDGLGGFPTILNASIGAGGIAGFAVADINQDGNLDVAWTHLLLGVLFIHLGNGSGGFALSASGGLNSVAATISLGDPDLDGDLDVAVNSFDPVTTQPLVRIFVGNGLGGIAPGPALLPFAGTASFADANGDGLPDLLGADGATAKLDVWLGNGALGFAPPVSSATAPGCYLAVIADVDADGRIDGVGPNYPAARATVALNQSPLPSGSAIYGVGTPGCGGRLGIGATAPPNVGSANFAITFTNAPPQSLGLLLVTDAQDAAGSDPLGIQLVFHVGLATAANVIALAPASGAGGCGAVAAPIPNDPFLVGNPFFAQSFWIELAAHGVACGAAAAHLVSSRGLAIAIQP